MLRESNRIGRQEGFGHTLKEGGKSGNRVLVVSVLLAYQDSEVERNSGSRAGVIVGKRQVPQATRRNRIKRRLRHLLAERLGSLPDGTTVVVRALEGAVDMPSEELGVNLDRLLASAFNKATRKTTKEATDKRLLEVNVSGREQAGGR